MNIGQLKAINDRFDVVDLSNLEIQAYGDDNLYPQRIAKLLACSDTGVNCLTRYVDFIRGNGFKDEIFASMQINPFGDTFDDLHDLLSSDLGNFNGFAIHFNYDLTGAAVGVQHVPFENCRLGIADDFGVVRKIAVFPDWSGEKQFGGKRIKPTKQTIDYIDVFNPKREVVLAQIEAAGGIEAYKGQVLWISAAGRYTYPRAKYDSAVTYLSTEDGLGNISNRNVKNGFFPAGMLITRRGQDSPEPTTENGTDVSMSPRLHEQFFASSISEQIGKLQGDQNVQKILCVEIEIDDEKPEFIPIKGENYDKDFEVTSKNATERIYAAFQQETFYRLREGSIGFSSEMIIDAFDYYNLATHNQRRLLMRAYDKIVNAWHEELSENDTQIEPLKYVSTNENTSDNGIYINNRRITY